MISLAGFRCYWLGEWKWRKRKAETESGKLKTETGIGRQKLTRAVVRVNLPLMPLKMEVGC